MTTIDDVLAIQKASNILFPPAIKAPVVEAKLESAVSTSGKLTISLCNSSTSSTVYAYITGLAISNNSSLFLLESDGSTPYYPENPTSNGTALSANCAIALGAPGSTRTVTIPYIAGGRIWFCVGSTLTFLLNPSDTGPGLVEPSVSNTSDPNYLLSWDFCEFTFNSAQIYANISYVDFVCLPISLDLTSSSGASYHVGGLPSNGLQTICNNLTAQNNIDNAGWDQLIVKNNGSILRALSPTNGILFNPSLFQDYWTSYLNSVWQKYISAELAIDTQASWGVVNGHTSNDRTSLTFTPLGSFTKPSAADIFGANSGAFAAQATNTDALLNIGARLDAALNRSTLLTNSNQPQDEVVSTYYSNSVTNHYARIVHATNVDGKGYCFPYDDVTPDGGEDQSGFVSDPTPSNFLVTIGGGNAHAKRNIRARSLEQRSMVKRNIVWEENSKTPLFADVERDLEKGEHPKLINEISTSSTSPSSKVSPFMNRLLGPYITKLQAMPFFVERLQPFLSSVHQLLISIMSLSMRTILSRVFIAMFLLLFYLLGLLPHGSESHTQRRVLESSLGNATVVIQ